MNKFFTHQIEQVGDLDDGTVTTTGCDGITITFEEEDLFDAQIHADSLSGRLQRFIKFCLSSGGIRKRIEL